MQELIILLKGYFQVDDIVYHWVSAGGQQYGFGTYDPTWADRYIEADYLRIDPVILACSQRFSLFEWQDLDWSSKSAQAFRKDACGYGIGAYGLSIPIRGPNGQLAILSASNTDEDTAWKKFIATEQRNWIIVAHYINDRVLQLSKKRMPEPMRALSPREVDALTHLAMGYGRGQAAELLNISEHTLRAYIESARFKLGASNTTHAVARATSEGLIVVSRATRTATGAWPERAVIGKK